MDAISDTTRNDNVGRGSDRTSGYGCIGSKVGREVEVSGKQFDLIFSWDLRGCNNRLDFSMGSRPRAILT